MTAQGGETGFHSIRTTGRGFNLIEALVVITVAAIMLGLTAGKFSALAQREAGRAAMSALANSIHLARSAAVENITLVTLCRSADGRACNGQWRDGHIVFIDHDGDHSLDSEDRLLHWHNRPASTGTIHWRAFQNRQYLQITSLGFTRYQNGNFTYCPLDGDARGAIQLIVSRTARVRYAQDGDGDGIVEDSQGRPVDCG